jgi:LmbE family N-acetylglucosaminyl deacetylase
VLDAEIPERALAIYAHPDDPEISAGGTLARWADNGCEVHLAITTRGDKGTNDPDADRDALARLRVDETKAAARVLGVAGHHHLDHPDGEIEDDRQLRLELVRLVRTVQPDIVMCPDPTAVFFGDGYINHRDHRQLGWAVLDSVVPAAMPLYVPEAGPAHQVELLLLSGTLEANAWVDIGDVLDVKVAAVACHESRLGSDTDLIAAILEERAREEGARAGVTCAEAFRRLRFTGTG